MDYLLTDSTASNLLAKGSSFVPVSSQKKLQSQIEAFFVSAGFERRAGLGSILEGSGCVFGVERPSSSLPNPSDIFILSLNSSSMVSQDNNSDVPLINYIENYSSLSVSKGYVYILLIKNLLIFKEMQDNNFDRAQENKIYSRLLNEHLTVDGLDF
ncbi:hypothetical protein ACF3OC_07315 [Sphingobacterium cellulitidis]|uniref:hypothetical protein n=1 Tax=Sphingobacterium cellulitidis TaxID=1768011 RepID=UPI00370DBFEE